MVASIVPGLRFFGSERRYRRGEDSLAERESELLPVPYFHMAFTLPDKIGRLALRNAEEIYRVPFRAAPETLLTIAADPQRLGAHIGFLAVLHTWGQNLHLHPHLHCMVPGRGMTSDGTLLDSVQEEVVLPAYQVLSAATVIRRSLLPGSRYTFFTTLLH